MKSIFRIAFAIGAYIIFVTPAHAQVNDLTAKVTSKLGQSPVATPASVTDGNCYMGYTGEAQPDGDKVDIKTTLKYMQNGQEKTMTVADIKVPSDDLNIISGQLLSHIQKVQQSYQFRNRKCGAQAAHSAEPLPATSTDASASDPGQPINSGTLDNWDEPTPYGGSNGISDSGTNSAPVAVVRHASAR